MPYFGVLHHLQRRAEQAPGDVALVDAETHPGGSRQHEERVRADDHRDRERAAALARELQQPPQMAAGVQARRELGLRVQHRAVVAEVPGARVGMLGGDDAVGDVGRPIRLEVTHERQRSEIDFRLLDRIEHRARGHDAGRDELARAGLVGLVKPRRVSAEQARDPRPRSEDVGDDLDPEPAHALEHDHGMTPLRRELPHDGGDVLIGRDFVPDDEDVLGVRGLIALEEGAEVLLARRARVRHRPPDFSA